MMNDSNDVSNVMYTTCIQRIHNMKATPSQ